MASGCDQAIRLPPHLHPPPHLHWPSQLQSASQPSPSQVQALLHPSLIVQWLVHAGELPEFIPAVAMADASTTQPITVTAKSIIRDMIKLLWSFENTVFVDILRDS